MKTVILRTHKRTKSNSFSDPFFRTLTVAPSVGLFSKVGNETDKTDNCPVTINYVNNQKCYVLKDVIVSQIVNL
jgi:hypothetical protein